MSPDRQSLTAEELAEVLKRLDEVLAEAERLKREVATQLAARRADRQLSSPQPKSARGKTGQSSPPARSRRSKGR